MVPFLQNCLIPPPPKDFGPQSRVPVLSIPDGMHIPEGARLTVFPHRNTCGGDSTDCLPSNSAQIFTVVSKSWLEKVKVHGVKLPLLTLNQIKNMSATLKALTQDVLGSYFTTPDI